MAIDVNIMLDSPDPDLKFTTPTALFNAIRTALAGTITQTLTPYVIGVTTPTVDQQGLAWIRLDSAGRPAGIYVFYNGRWVREAPSQGALIGLFAGDPVPWFDGTGKGLSGAGAVALDFFGWALMNGNNGTQNLSDRFIIGARMDNVGITGYSAGWRTNVNGRPEGLGGNATITLDEDTTFQPAQEAITVGGWSADANSGGSDGGLLGLPVGAGGSHDLQDAIAGNTSPDAIEISPPFFALAYIQWIGY